MIHPQACVDPNVMVGPGTRVWQFASVIRRASIGRDCNIASCAIVDGATLGNLCTVGHGAQIHPGITMGDEVFVGPGAIFCNDPWPRVRKGDFNIDKILSGFVVTRVGNRASIGAGAVVLPGVTIGDDAMVSAGAVVNKSVPPMHMFKRDGSIVEIQRRQVTRMRAAA